MCINYARAIQAEVRWIQGTIKHTFSDTQTETNLLFAFGLTVFIYSRQSLYETLMFGLQIYPVFSNNISSVIITLSVSSTLKLHHIYFSQIS